MSQEPFIGQIQIYTFNKVPKGYLPCNGQLVSIQQNQALYALLGTTYGGNGQTTFGLPNLQGIAAMSSGTDGTGTQYAPGQTGGEEFHQLVQTEMPTHTHNLNASTNAGTTQTPTGNYLATAMASGGTSALNMYGPGPSRATLASSTIGMTGNGQGHENRMPYLALNFCICTVGVFPSRP